MTYAALRQELLALAEPGYQAFTARLIPGEQHILGVRIPALRKIAKTIAKGDWQGYLAAPQGEYHEEILLQGLVIGYIQTDAAHRCRLILDFLPKITNWAVCDSFVSGLKAIPAQPAAFYPLIEECLQSPLEFSRRFAFVVLLHYYVEEPYLAAIFTACDHTQGSPYSVKMAVAWLLSVCYVKVQPQTITYLQHCALEEDIFRKTLQKIRDSHRIDQAQKNDLQQLPHPTAGAI